MENNEPTISSEETAELESSQDTSEEEINNNTEVSESSEVTTELESSSNIDKETIINEDKKDNQNDEPSSLGTILLLIVLIELVVFIVLVVKNSQIEYPSCNDGRISSYKERSANDE